MLRATNLLGITSCKVKLTVLPRATNLLGITSCKVKLTVLPRATNLLGITSCKVKLTVLPRATNLLGITSCKVKLTLLLRATNLLGITSWQLTYLALPPVKEESKQDCEKWAEKDGKVQSIIVTHIEDSVLQQIISCKTACDIWNKLHTVYEQKKQQKFFEVKYKKNKTMSEYLGRVDAILDNLKSLGAHVNESIATTTIISSL
ncbi:hypothetical protein PR048_018760 [Dryococelus australis]|uniref:Uncharacterized protein n=1 Tax=Dryococelus australis TaxID=614101 RepID=A0ABQ9HD56_9NEOP|nr:hypothetical protein PR048_018760 [Dryococelus australis]